MTSGEGGGTGDATFTRSAPALRAAMAARYGAPGRPATNDEYLSTRTFPGTRRLCGDKSKVTRTGQDLCSEWNADPCHFSPRGLGTMECEDPCRPYPGSREIYREDWDSRPFASRTRVW